MEFVKGLVIALIECVYRFVFVFVDQIIIGD